MKKHFKTKMGIFCAILKDEFRVKNLGLNYPDRSHFETSQWPIPQGVYVIYRWLIAVFFTVWIVLSGVWKYDWYDREEDRIKWFLFYTNWSFLLLTLDTIWQALIATKALCANKIIRQGSNKITTPLKIYWMLHNIAANSAIDLSIAYWVAIYKGGYVHPVTIVVHAVNSVYVILDLCVAAIPVRLLHIYHGLLYAYIYWGVFNPVYCLTGGTNALGLPYIYTPIDWKADPGKAALLSALVVIVELIVWMVLFSLYKCRLAVARQCGVTTHPALPGIRSDADTERAPLIPKEDQTDV